MGASVILVYIFVLNYSLKGGSSVLGIVNMDNECGLVDSACAIVKCECMIVEYECREVDIM